MFDFLTTKFEDLFYKIRNKGKLSPSDLDAALREIKLALLEADVNFKVVKEFLDNIKQKAIGKKITESLTPYQQIVKIVNDEIAGMLGNAEGKVIFSGKPPMIIMVAGLQGTGKTSAVVKLANHLSKEYSKSVSVITADIYRPAAAEQLKVMSESIGVEVYWEKSSDPVKIAERGIQKFKKMGRDAIIIDTAGRMHVDDGMMKEISDIKRKVKPHQVYLVLDSMTGQEAVNIAKVFNERLNYDGIILTKVDSDSKGGAALSVFYVTQKPIKFISTGERISDFEAFRPDRIASRILGMGDIISLVENAEKVIDKKEAEKFEEKIRKNELNFEDFVEQIKGLKKMGSMDKIFSMLPVPNKSKILKNVNIDDSQLKTVESIIGSMTKNERRHPEIINGSRKKRIAIGSGTTVSEVNKLLKQFDSTRRMLKQFSVIGQGAAFPFDKIR